MTNHDYGHRGGHLLTERDTEYSNTLVAGTDRLQNSGSRMTNNYYSCYGKNVYHRVFNTRNSWQEELAIIASLIVCFLANQIPLFCRVSDLSGMSRGQFPSRFVVYNSLPSSRDFGRDHHYPGDLRYSQRRNRANNEQGLIRAKKLQPRCSIPSHNLVRCWPSFVVDAGSTVSI